MEFCFLDDVDIELNDSCEFVLPNYVTSLSQKEIFRAKSIASNDGRKTVIAAGTDPKDGKITLVTSSGKVMVFDAKKYHIPFGPAVPCDGGTKIFLQNVEGRWPGPSPGFYVDSQWMLEKSVSALMGATLITNYRNENKS